MVEVLEKTDARSRDAPLERLYYDIKTVQQGFALPSKPTFFLHESFLLCFYFLRDKRFRQIARVIFKLSKDLRNNSQCAPLVLNAFVDLGPTFIKIGQFLSSRRDIIPKEYIEALSSLQDSLPPIPFNEIKPVIESELRKSVDLIFKSIESEPIASASIGQVYRAKLLNDLDVVIKIQRPNLHLYFYQDLAILRCLATFLERYSALGKDREWVQIIDEVGKTLFEEIDFIQEGKNADKLRKNLKHEERIYIPRIFWKYTTKRLITIEFVPGIKITDVDSLIKNNFNPKELALILSNAYFKQVFEDGFYHADPHPGNIVVKKDGAIVFYDFGMVGRINKNIRAELMNVLISIIGNDTDTLLSTLRKLDLIKKDVDITPIKKVIEEAAYKYYSGAKLKSLDLTGIEGDLKKLFEEKPMKLPSKFTYTLRATGTLEGVCRTLDPDFSLIAAAKPFLQNWIKEHSPESKWIYLKTLFPNQSKLIDKIKIYMDVIRDLPKYVSKIEKSNVEMSRANMQTDFETEHFKAEITEANSKLNITYTIIFLLSFVFIGNYLITSSNTLISLFGFILLIVSLIGSIGIVAFSVFRKK